MAQRMLSHATSCRCSPPRLHVTETHCDERRAHAGCAQDGPLSAAWLLLIMVVLVWGFIRATRATRAKLHSKLPSLRCRASPEKFLWVGKRRLRRPGRHGLLLRKTYRYICIALD